MRQAPLTVMVLLGPDGAVYALRNSIGPDAATWVEELDPESLEERRRSPDLALGPYWPGGFGVLDDGSLLVVQGRWAHRLSPGLEVVARRRLPVDAPYNSFVLLPDGTVVTKDLQRPGGPASTLLALDPATLQDRGEPLTLAEPCVSRLSTDGDEVVVVGVTTLARHRWAAEAGRFDHLVGGDVRYLVHDDQSFGWDPVIEGGRTWWMDNGDHTFERTLSMLGNGVAAGPVRLWRAGLDGGGAESVEVCGRPHGAVTNPPLVDVDRGLVVAYDSANGVMAAFDVDSLERRWTAPIATAQHLVLYPDTGEVLADDHDPEVGDSLVVVDVSTGEVRARVGVESPAQSVVFGAPGLARDAYYVSLSTIARVTFHD